MSRSVKKGPFVEESLMKKIEAMNASNEKHVIKTWSRSSTIVPDMVGHTIAVYDGMNSMPSGITRFSGRGIPANALGPIEEI